MCEKQILRQRVTELQVENAQIKESLKNYARLISDMIKALDMIDYTMECEGLINKAKEMSNNA